MSDGHLQLGVAALSGGVLQWAIRPVWKLITGDAAGKALAVRNQAEARKLNAEADQVDWLTMRDEIGRLNSSLTLMREEVHKLKNALGSADAQVLVEARAHRQEINALQESNRVLRATVTKLTVRVRGLESILKVKPLTNEDKDLLAELDRQTKRWSKRP